MPEDFRKNFILLSEVAKEKKYAQEYLGLLARRGDIGSIRLGKRWYTTWEWFEEFLESSQKKKSKTAGEAQVQEAAKLERKDFAQEQAQEEKIVPKIETKPVFVKIPTPVSTFAKPAVSEKKPAIAEKFAKVPVTNNSLGRQSGVVGDIQIIRKRPALNQKKSVFRNISVEERNRQAIPYPEIKFKKKEGIFSPTLFVLPENQVSLFSRFALAASFVIVLLLTTASGYLFYVGGLREKGKVAGASDERSGGFSGIKIKSDYYLAGMDDKVKESLSVSRVMVEAAKKKSEGKDLENSEE
jgi:hypothetical protein